jgi:hypothetical protein
MNEQDAIAVLKALAQGNERLIELYFSLNSTPGVVNVSRGFDLRTVDSGCRAEAFVEAELKDGRAFCWWIDIIFSDERWQIDPSLSLTQAGEQSEIEQFPESTGTTLTSLIQCANESFDLVTAAALEFAKTGFAPTS